MLRPESEEAVREYARMEIKKIAERGLELSDGRMIPVTVFPRELRDAVNRMIDIFGIQFFTHAKKENFLVDFQLSRERDVWNLRSPKGYRLSDISEQKRVDVLAALQSVQDLSADTSRAVRFTNEMDLLQSLVSAKENGGADTDPDGTCLDPSDEWAKKYVAEYTHSRQNPVAVYLYREESLERVPEDVRARNTNLKYYGMRPKSGSAFTDALLGVLVFE